ncbi:Ferrichrome-iron receptor [Haemophilus haemolyticus]|uniref:Ferrichrome-iron receptor n=1 Tax=Haemophilus haemolyticus TaxID=726 RepID=A0AAQ2BK18_HAEHA|nr:Ferrichrome-iron receptor [Haemophilus haemolyticus]
MNFKLSLVYTALFAGISVSFVANVNAKEHSTNEDTLEGIEVIAKIKLKQNGTKKPSRFEGLIFTIVIKISDVNLNER